MAAGRGLDVSFEFQPLLHQETAKYVLRRLMV
jgi:hypothetical protein